MEDIIKYNVKNKYLIKKYIKTLVTQNQEIKQVTYMLTYTDYKTFKFGKQY